MLDVGFIEHRSCVVSDNEKEFRAVLLWAVLLMDNLQHIHRRVPSEAPEAKKLQNDALVAYHERFVHSIK